MPYEAAQLTGLCCQPAATSTKLWPAPRTSDPSHQQIPISLGSTPDVTTPSPSTATSTTPCGSAEPTPSATPANTSTCSVSRSASTASPFTNTDDDATPPSPPEHLRAPHAGTAAPGPRSHERKRQPRTLRVKRRTPDQPKPRSTLHRPRVSRREFSRPRPRRAGRKPRTPSSDEVRDQGWERISSIWERRLPIFDVTGRL